MKKETIDKQQYLWIILNLLMSLVFLVISDLTDLNPIGALPNTIIAIGYLISTKRNKSREKEK